MRPGNGAGFTLIEILIALTIGAMVVLMVHQAFGSIIDLNARLEEAQVAHAHEAHMRAALEQAFGSLEIGFKWSRGFEGSPTAACFSTAAHRRVTVAAAGDWLILRTDSTRVDTLAKARDLNFDYLMSYGADASWVRSWSSPMSAPLAVRVRARRDSLSADTLFFVIGPRG